MKEFIFRNLGNNHLAGMCPVLRTHQYQFHDLARKLERLD
jgi:hypothetical protein